MTVDPFGLRRVVSPEGALPQGASRLDLSLPLAEDELEIDVDRLNIDAASFRQMEQSTGGGADAVAARILEIVRERGKMHNPVTGSGGILMGRVRRVGRQHPGAGRLKTGDRIATLVSLSLTPLELDQVQAVHPHAARVDVRGRAILFASGPYARLPGDMPDELALAVFDVCGAPAHVARLARQDMRVLVIGAGKSGALACAAAKERVGGRGQVLALDLDPRAPERFVDAGLADVALAADATRPLDVLRSVQEATEQQLCALVVNCASVAGTEMASILCTREGGEVLFFSMATSFTAAALGAEGVARDVRLSIGNGYARGHADLALDLVRARPALRRLLEARVRG